MDCNGASYFQFGGEVVGNTICFECESFSFFQFFFIQKHRKFWWDPCLHSLTHLFIHLCNACLLLLLRGRPRLGVGLQRGPWPLKYVPPPRVCLTRTPSQRGDGGLRVGGRAWPNRVSQKGRLFQALEAKDVRPCEMPPGVALRFLRAADSCH